MSIDHNEVFVSPTATPTNTKEYVVEITEKDKENFYKSFISDQPFKEKVDLFDGKVKVEFKALTVQDVNDLMKQVLIDEKNENITKLYDYQLACYRLCMSLTGVDGFAYSGHKITKETYPGDEKVTYVRARLEEIKKWSGPKLGAIQAAFLTFEQKTIKLEKAVLDKDFWKASA